MPYGFIGKDCGCNEVCWEGCGYTSLATASGALGACLVALGVSCENGRSTCECICHGCPCCAKCCATSCYNMFSFFGQCCHSCCYNCCSCCFCCESYAMAAKCFARCLWGLSSCPFAICCLSTVAVAYLVLPKEKRAFGELPNIYVVGVHPQAPSSQLQSNVFTPPGAYLEATVVYPIDEPPVVLAQPIP